jgi:tetratricopeptide (TPR) repeat protein
LPSDHSSTRKQQTRLNLKANEAAWQEIVQSAARLQQQADALRARGDLTGAIRGYGAAIESGPPNTALYYLRGTVRLELGDKVGAMEDFEHGLRLDPNNDTLKCLLAQAANE